MIFASLHQTEFKKYFVNTSWVIGEKISLMVLAFFVGIFVARYLGPEKFGLFSYALSYVSLFQVLSKLGLDGILSRTLIQKPEHYETLLGTSFVLKLLGAFAILILIFISFKVVPSNTYMKLLIIVVALGKIFEAFNVIDIYFKSQVQAKYSSLANFSSSLTSGFLKILLIFLKYSLIWFSIVIVLEQMILSIMLLFIFTLKGHCPFNWHFDLKLAKNLLRDSWPLILSGLMVMIYLRIDQIMIKLMINDQALGNYAAAVKLSEIWYLFPIVITQSIFPAILKAKMKSKKIYFRRLQTLYDLMVWLAIVIAVPISFFSNWTISLLYGDAYTTASIVLTIHIWTSVFVFLGLASDNYLLAEGLMKLTLYRSCFGVIVNITLNVILIRNYGIIGAAISTLVSQVMASFVFDLLNKRTIKSFKMKLKSFFPIHILSLLSN